ncbi:MAG: hypothetical protein DRH51_05590 [Candidatus Coatesbacteria bacterium]|nr:MAG: hypothetical protein DRH51_05590 [Candidatus Coatesbacteria bacterium]
MPQAALPIATVVATGYQAYQQRKAAKRLPQIIGGYPQPPVELTPEEEERERAARRERQRLREEILKTVGITSPERERQIEEEQRVLEERLKEASEPLLTSMLYQRGLRGSTTEASTLKDLAKEIAKESVLTREERLRRDEEQKMRWLQLLEQGLSADVVRRMREQAMRAAPYEARLAREAWLNQMRQRMMANILGPLSTISLMWGLKTPVRGFTPQASGYRYLSI